MCFAHVAQLFREFPLPECACLFRAVVEAAASHRLRSRSVCAVCDLDDLSELVTGGFELPYGPIVVEDAASCTFLWDMEEGQIGLHCLRGFLVCQRDDRIQAGNAVTVCPTRRAQGSYLLTWGVWGATGDRPRSAGSPPFDLTPIGGIFIDPTNGLNFEYGRSSYAAPQQAMLRDYLTGALLEYAKEAP